LKGRLKTDKPLRTRNKKMGPLRGVAKSRKKKKNAGPEPGFSSKKKKGGKAPYSEKKKKTKES